MSSLMDRRIVRITAGASDRQPVVEIDGASPPTWSGRSYHWTTMGGAPIRHPAAYRWPMIYHASTLTLTVGRDWVARHRTPSGLEWRTDSYGTHLVRLTDGMDYHPTRDDLRSRHFTARVRAAMARQYRDRIAARRAAAEIDALVPLLCVSIEDSRRAGNCIAGTLAYAERRLGMATHDDIIRAGHLATVDAATALSRATTADAGER